MEGQVAPTGEFFTKPRIFFFGLAIGFLCGLLLAGVVFTMYFQYAGKPF